MGREHVRIVGHLQRRGVVQRGDDVTVVNVQRARERREISVFRKSMRLLGFAGLLVAVWASRYLVGAKAVGRAFDSEMVGLVGERMYLHEGGGMVMLVLAVGLALWAAVKDGFCSALGVLVLVLPAALVLSFIAFAMIGAVLMR